VKSILIDMFPANGHYSAILKLAKVLDNNGLHVVVSGDIEFKQRVEKQGLEYLTANPLLLIPQKSLKKLGQKRSLFQKKTIYVSKRKEEWMENLERWEASILPIDPSLVLLDEQNALKAGAYMSLGIPVAFFQTKPDTRKINGIPPFTCYFVPQFTAISNWYSCFLWLIKEIKPRCKQQLRKLKLIGTDDITVYLSAYKEIGIALSNRIDIIRSFGIGIKGLSRIVVSPAPFDFPHDEVPSVYRVGPLVDIRREGKIDQPRYQILIKNIEKHRENPKSRIIYASMGTISGQDLPRCTRFFLRMEKVARMNPDSLFVLATGKAFDINLLLPLPNNLMVFETVPQVDLLQKCDIMVTHGGMNSITECVFCEVPMLVYPLSRKWDQPGNSARVVYLGLGLRGRIERDSAKTISRKINLLIDNYPNYKDNVLKMKQKFEEKNNSTEIVTIIESLLSNSTKN